MNIEKIKEEIIHTTKLHLVNRLYEGLCVDETLLNAIGINHLVKDCVDFYSGKNDHLEDRLDLVPQNLRQEFKHSIKLMIRILNRIETK